MWQRSLTMSMSLPSWSEQEEYKQVQGLKYIWLQLYLNDFIIIQFSYFLIFHFLCIWMYILYLAFLKKLSTRCVHTKRLHRITLGTFSLLLTWWLIILLAIITLCKIQHIWHCYDFKGATVRWTRKSQKFLLFT